MGSIENKWPRYSYDRKKYLAEVKPIREHTRDYTYGRLYNESRMYLNKSGSKFISIGIHPGVGFFRREIRLHTATGEKPYSILLEPSDLIRLFEMINELPGMRKTEIVGTIKMDADEMNDGETDDDEDEDVGATSTRKKRAGGKFDLRKTDIGADVYKITTPNDQSMFLGHVSLQKLLDLQPIIYLVYKDLDPMYLKSLYDKLIEDLSVDDYPIHKVAEVVTDALQREAINNWDNRSFYTQTCIHFTDFVVAHIAFLRHSNKNK